MIQIDCPLCGLRDESEYTWGGEAHICRPENPDTVGDEEWGSYLFMRENPRGNHRERWCHSYGCNQWFNLIRDTVSHKITSIYPIDHLAPESADDNE